jgi:hypothetical protein
MTADLFIQLALEARSSKDQGGTTQECSQPGHTSMFPMTIRESVPLRISAAL